MYFQVTLWQQNSEDSTLIIPESAAVHDHEPFVSPSLTSVLMSSSYLRIGLTRDFPTKILYALLAFPILAIFPAHRSHMDFPVITILELEITY